MDIDPKLVKQLMELFEGELREQIQIIVDALLALEKGAEGEDQPELLNSAFRAAHNIKGAGQGVNVVDVADIAHRLESLFSVFKQKQTAPPATLINLCLESLDRMGDAMADFLQERPTQFDLKSLLSKLDQATNDPDTYAPPSGSDPVNVVPATKSAPKEPEVSEAVRIESDSAEQTKTPAVIDADTTNETIRVRIDKVNGVAALAEEFQVFKIEIDEHLSSVQKINSQMDNMYKLWKNTVPTWANNGANLPDELSHFLTAGTDSVTELHNNVTRIHKDLRISASRVELLSMSLQDDVHMLRLQPAATMLKPLERSVRDIAQELGKQVNFVISGAENEIDRAVLDVMRDPLIHLFRNAIDHGIESPEERLARGKPEVGHLGIKVQREGNEILMIVNDDGAGINADAIAAIAQKKNLVTEAELEKMEPQEVIELVFHPGFSSKEIITDISGRGVGLDVVRTNLRKLKGSVQIDTEEGMGTRFTLRLPLTLTTERGLLVRVGGAVFAIPATSVDRVMELPLKDIVNVEATQAVLIDDRAVPLRDLSQVLEMDNYESVSRDTINIVTVSKGWKVVAFVVEEIIGEREIVIKPLRPPLLSVRNVSGGTLTGSGEIIMVLNTMDLVDNALSPGKSKKIVGQVESEDISVPSILVVDDSITTRTLEKSILESVGYKVTVAVDGKEAWDVLQGEQFDLVISDVEMPIMDGFALTERIKQSEKLAEMPVIIVTSLAKDSDRKRGIEVGADDYLVKSQFETKALLEVVAQMV